MSKRKCLDTNLEKNDYNLKQNKTQKIRQYNIQYLQYGFMTSPTDHTRPMCIFCENVFSNEAMKPSRLKEHLSKKHSEKNVDDILKLKKMKEAIENRPTLKLFKTTKNNQEDGIIASYRIAKLIAKCGKPHTIAESLIMPSILEIMKTVLKMDTCILKSIPLSNSTVSRRIDEMGEDVENQLCFELRKTNFSIQLDESVIRGNESILMAYVRFVKDRKIYEEMLFCESLKSDTKGETMYEVLKTYFSKNSIPLNNMISCATDGAPSMIGRQAGLASLIKKEVPGLFVIHCVIHRQHLVAKRLSERLFASLSLIISAVNKIKIRAFNTRLFRELCHENGEEYDNLLLHTEVRWLSKGSCLKRFIQLYDSIIEFLQLNDDSQLACKIQSIHGDLAYLADIYDKMNILNLQLQGNNFSLIQAKNSISCFMSKIKLYKLNLGRKELSQFPSMKSIADTYTDDDFRSYCAHLQQLHEDFEIRFKDLIELNIPDWIRNPFACKPEDQKVYLQETLIELQCDQEEKMIFENQGLSEMWLHCSFKFPLLWNEAELFILAFPTSYMVEKGFSSVSQILATSRNRLDVLQRGDLRLLLSSMEPNILELAGHHQPQGSH